jgi:hypothetical protein
LELVGYGFLIFEEVVLDHICLVAETEDEALVTKVEPSNGREATAIRLTEGPSILPENFAIVLP